MRSWSLQNAKARFSELVNTCLENGPQMVTRHGHDTVVMIAVKEFQQITTPRQGLGDFFLSAPRVELEIGRPGDTGRDISL